MRDMLDVTWYLLTRFAIPLVMLAAWWAVQPLRLLYELAKLAKDLLRNRSE